jgi:ubiquitin-conjugating enzyme E2 Q
MDYVRTVSRSGAASEAVPAAAAPVPAAVLQVLESAAVADVDSSSALLVAAVSVSVSSSSRPSVILSSTTEEEEAETTGAAALALANRHSSSAAVVVVENSTERAERTTEAARGFVEDDEDDDEAKKEALEVADIPPEDEELEDDEDEEDEYEYEDEDEGNFAGFLVDQPALATAVATRNSLDDEDEAKKQPAKIEEEEVSAAAAAPAKWREPSRQAVTMSLRAEKETSGSKRRLAQDLYRIMNKDTVETGFSLEPESEDQMDSWKINLFQFDEDSMLAKDLKVLGLTAVELEMKFPEQYPFSPPFCRVTRPRFKRQTGFVMNGALCMELLTSDGWNPVNDIESVIVSIRSLLVVGEGRLEAAASLPAPKYQALLEASQASQDTKPDGKRLRTNSAGDSAAAAVPTAITVTGYSDSEAKAAYEHLSSYHKKKGWDQSGWWARKG